MIQGHAFGYTGCKTDASANLHGEAFFTPSLCATLPGMARKPTYIRAWREEKGLTLDQMVGRLAELGVDTTVASLSRIERGKQPYSQDIIEAIAEALGVTMSHLTERNPTMPPAKIINFLDHLNPSEVQRAEDVLRAMFGERA